MSHHRCQSEFGAEDDKIREASFLPSALDSECLFPCNVIKERHFHANYQVNRIGIVSESTSYVQETAVLLLVALQIQCLICVDLLIFHLYKTHQFGITRAMQIVCY